MNLLNYVVLAMLQIVVINGQSLEDRAQKAWVEAPVVRASPSQKESARNSELSCSAYVINARDNVGNGHAWADRTPSAHK
jgi:hypothetical protein